MSSPDNPISPESPSLSITCTSTPPEIRRGLPVYEPEIQGRKLADRDILVTINGQEQKIPIDTLRAQFYAGVIPADAPVLS